MSAISFRGSIAPVATVPAVATTASGRTPAARSRADRSAKRVHSHPPPFVHGNLRIASLPSPNMSAARSVVTCTSLLA